MYIYNVIKGHEGTAVLPHSVGSGSSATLLGHKLLFKTLRLTGATLDGLAAYLPPGTGRNLTRTSNTPRYATSPVEYR